MSQSFKPIMAAPAAQTHKIKAPNNFPPDNLKEAYRKAILNTIDWSAIEIIKPDKRKTRKDGPVEDLPWIMNKMRI